MLLCKEELPKSLIKSEYHLSLANAAYRFSSELGKQKLTFSKIKHKTIALDQLIQKFIKIYQQKDIQKMKEILFIVSINEHVQLIKKTPTNVEAHASLANTYVALSRVYENQETQKFQAATKKAIQEFKIINYYSPRDPWVHAQLASCYHDLKQFQDEMKEYETILSICPEDKQILFRLGILYFQKGSIAKGLEIYEKLKNLQFSRAEELIDFYDANIKQEYFITKL